MACATGGVALSTLVRIYAEGQRTTASPADAAVVFGAAVWDSGPSPELAARLDRAAELHTCGLVGLIVCCGGITDGVAETIEMRRQLVARGVPAEMILVDDRGGSSRQALEAVAALGHRRWRSVLLVSSPYHIHRLLREAHRRGLHASGAPAALAPALRPGPSGFDWRLVIYRVSQHIREIGATWWYALPFRPSTIEVRKAAKVARASARLTQMVAREHPDGGQLSRWDPDRTVILSPPVAGSVISGFGWRSPRHHDGVDFEAAYGSPVMSAGDGSVVFAGQLPMYGRVIAILHGARLATVYGHLARLDVGAGDEVDAGQPIGHSGSSGNAFGPHLHFELRLDGVPVDPGYLLSLDPVDAHRRGPTWISSAIWMWRRFGSITYLDRLQASCRSLARPAGSALRRVLHIPAPVRSRVSP